MDSEHKKLTDIITGVHDKLKRSLFLTKNPQKVWLEHVKEEDLRKNYSLAMLKLATEVWGNKECRIEWSYNTCREYFYDGGLQKSLSREIKLKEKLSKKINEARYSCCDIINNYENTNEKLKLLDVGSCNNLFSKFKEFACVAIDLTPATEDVIQCDFLLTDIHEKSNEAHTHSSLAFYEESFDIVVFSMVLEYLPAAEQRAIFCFKAWQLLQINGLCIIITPDSKSLHHNAPMMKSWKLALEKIGFIRVKYDKLTHIHCMAFRKCSRYSDVNMTNCKLLAHLLYTPQDFKTYEEDVIATDRNEEENHLIFQQFSELPNLN